MPLTLVFERKPVNPMFDVSAAALMVDKFRSLLSLLQRVDRTADGSLNHHLIGLMIGIPGHPDSKKADGELGELENALSLPHSPEVVAEIQGEISDLFVFILSMLAASRHRRLAFGPTPSVNGEGAKSNIIDKIREVGLDLHGKNPERSIERLLDLLQSLVKNLPVSYRLADLERKLTVVLGNRPPEYYHDHHISGRLLTDEESLDRYSRLEKMGRWLRNQLGRGLKLADFLPYDPIFSLDQDVDVALTQLKKVFSLDNHALGRHQPVVNGVVRLPRTNGHDKLVGPLMPHTAVIYQRGREV
jgi:hypothetical protein